MTVTLRATTDLVAVAWISDLFDTPMVATNLPKRGADGTISWASTGFVVVTTVGGSPHPYMPVRNPVVQIDCWAANPDSGSPPWGKANNLAEEIQNGFYQVGDIPRDLVLNAGFPGARVLSAWTVTEPRRVYDDEASYARYTMTAQFTWIELPS